MGGGLAKLRRNLIAILPMAQLPAPASGLIGSCTDTADALARLIEAGDAMSAARLGAFGLPRREAVWWASMCAAHTAPAGQPDSQIRARDAAEQWVRDQDDLSRRRAMDLAQAAGPDAPEYWVAVAAFWSGESLAPLGQPVVPPAPRLTGTAVAGAIGLAAVRGDPTRRNARLDRFLDSLRDIADGGAGRLGREMTPG
jgi:hypothetical protein